MDKLEKAKNILNLYNQNHLLHFYNEISDEQKEVLLNQILRINFDEIIKLYNNSKINSNKNNYELSPITHYEKELLSKEDINYYTNIGENVLKSNSFAVVTMAGGQGTRLGYKGPKGTYELDLKPNKKSLFEIMCENIKEANCKYNISIPWYIMTSEENNAQTQKYFEEHNYFGYPKNKIHFFIQDKLPIISVSGKLLLQEIYLIKEASNGNGNVFNAMQKNKIIDDLEKNNIKWVSFGGIDNVLLKNVDPLFLGMTISKNEVIASKSIFKSEPLEKTAVFCKKDGKPTILDYDDIDLEISNSKNDFGLYKYREANIISHIMSIDAIKKVSNINLPYHRAYKKNTFINEEGMKQVPDSPNSFKFENFIFDAFMYFDNMLILRVDRDDEFAPIKDFTSINNPDTAIEKYLNYQAKKSK